MLAHYAQGLLHDLDREYDAALTNYLRAVELDPANEELNFRIAMGLLQQKRTDEAIALMEDLAARKPDSRQRPGLAGPGLPGLGPDRPGDRLPTTA